MQPNETLKPKMPEVHVPLGTEKEAPQWLNKLGMAVADMGRDIATANDMAKDKFDGDSAFMHTIRGFMTVGVGAGMEAAMDSLWDSVWQGKKTFIERFEIGSGVAKKLNTFIDDPNQRSFNWKARLGYLIKEGSQDLSIATIYNMIMTFRNQNLFTKVQPEHLASSLTVDALEALLSPHLPETMKRQAQMSQNAIIDSQVANNKQQIGNLRRSGSWAEAENADKRFDLIPADMLNDLTNNIRDGKVKWHQDNQEDINKLIDTNAKLASGKKSESELQIDNTKGVEYFFRSFLNYSNPVTNLGFSMIGDGFRRFFVNIAAVKKVRKEKGIVGKRVEMPREEKPWQRRDKKDYGNRREYDKDKKDKVYYGRSNWRDQKAQEEYELKMG